MEEVHSGLADVVVSETKISYVDGEKGKLIYRGYDINELAENSDFEETAYLLLYEKLPTKSELSSFRKKVRDEREINKACINIIKDMTKQTDSMDALRTIVSYIGQIDPEINKNDRESELKKSIRLMAKFPTIVAYYWRLREGKKVIAPRKDLSSGANFLYMLNGKLPSKTEERAMELDFVLTAEHGMNASTFAAIVATATESDMHSAVTSGICTLKGPLHGAARKEVYKMLEEIKNVKNAEKYVMAKVKKHQKVMGIGHRVYKTFDPRALVFKKIAMQLAEEKKDMKWIDISVKVEEVVLREFVEKKGKPIYPNVDFYTGAVYKYLGIPAELSTGIFAIGRVPGWCAHVMEQRANNKLIRPKEDYVGPKGLKYVPLGQRK